MEGNWGIVTSIYISGVMHRFCFDTSLPRYAASDIVECLEVVTGYEHCIVR